MSEGCNPTTKNRMKDYYRFFDACMIKAQYNCFIELPDTSSIVNEADARRHVKHGEFRLKIRLYKSTEKFDDEFELFGNDVNINTKVKHLRKIMTEKLGIPICTKGLHRNGIAVQFKDQDGIPLQEGRTFAHYNIFPNTTLHLRPAGFGKPTTQSTKSASDDSRLRQEVNKTKPECNKRKRNEYTTTIKTKRQKGRRSHIRDSDSEVDGANEYEEGYCHTA